MPSTEQAGTAPGGAAVPTGVAPGTAKPAEQAAGGEPREAPGAGLAGGRAPNGYATAALTLGITGFSLVTVIPAAVYGVLGLRRARRRGGAGVLRCWLGIAFAAVWAGLGGYLVPHLVLASDPGCASYKGPALDAYNKVIADFEGRPPRQAMITDISRAVTALDTAAVRSHSASAARDLSQVTAQLKIVLGDIRSGDAVPQSALNALNGAASRTDTDCGTLRF